MMKCCIMCHGGLVAPGRMEGLHKYLILTVAVAILRLVPYLRLLILKYY